MVPIAPLPPARSSTTTVAPIRSCRSCPSSRPMVSTAPPGGNGTTILMGWPCGHADCARAAGGASGAARPAAAATNRLRRVMSRRAGALTHPDREAGPLLKARRPFFSPPPCGEGSGVGVVRMGHLMCHTSRPSAPTLPRKGGGRRQRCPICDCFGPRGGRVSHRQNPFTTSRTCSTSGGDAKQ